MSYHKSEARYGYRDTDGRYWVRPGDQGAIHYANDAADFFVLLREKTKLTAKQAEAIIEAIDYRQRYKEAKEL